MNPPTHAAFLGQTHLVTGELPQVLAALKARFDADPTEPVWVFDLETGAQVEFDLRGPLDQVLARESPARSKGPGRPKLGVVGREVSLLPRHWDWLAHQPNGASAALRRLVEHAMRSEPERDRARRARAAAGRMLTALAGDLPNFEEVTRALYAGDPARLEGLVEGWPTDLRAFAVERALASAERTPAG